MENWEGAADMGAPSKPGHLQALATEKGGSPKGVPLSTIGVYHSGLPFSETTRCPIIIDNRGPLQTHPGAPQTPGAGK